MINKRNQWIQDQAFEIYSGNCSTYDDVVKGIELGLANVNNPELQDSYSVSKGVLESDPMGKSAHEPGAKLDSGKLRPYLVYAGFKRALREVWKDGTYGANKYSDNGWMEVPNARERYLDAFFRHFDKRIIDDELYDSESKVHHLGAAAWNLLAVLELELRELENKV